VRNGKEEGGKLEKGLGEVREGRSEK